MTKKNAEPGSRRPALVIKLPAGPSRHRVAVWREREEEEQSLERLRRRHRDLTDRHVFGAPETAEAAARLKQCVTVRDDYAEQVFRALHETKGQDR
ncbi:Chromate resistance protein ChrB [Streptomyces sp. NPDC092369]|uniref:Chromate resistance protein ChrB n=1 Tax=Streptomyces sp. NPDC092369 TaxID=3366015 RepID=UPI0038116877